MGFVSFLVGGVGLVIAAIILYAVVSNVMNSQNKTPNLGHGIMALIAIAIAIGGFSFAGSFGQIDAGYVGLQKDLGGYTGKVFGPGMYVTTPILTSVEVVDVRNQHQNLPQQVILTADQQSVPVDASINYNLSSDSSKLVKTMQYVGQDYYDKAVESQFTAALKATLAKYQFGDINSHLDTITTQVAQDTERRVRQIAGTDAIQIQQVSIKNIQPSDQLKNAIEQKVIAAQNAQTEKMNLSKIQYQVQQSVAQAKGQAQSQQYQARTITPEYLKLKQLEVCATLAKNWNGVLAPFSQAPCAGLLGNDNSPSQVSASNTIVNAQDLAAVMGMVEKEGESNNSSSDPSASPSPDPTDTPDNSSK